MKFYIEWILLFVAAEAVISLVQFLLRKKKIKKSVRTVIVIAKLLFSIACAVIVMGGPVFFRPVQPLMSAVYAALFADAVADIAYSAFLAIKKSERKFAAVKILSLVFGVLFFVYGTVNMETVRPSYHTYSSEKLENEYTVVFVADLHVGSSQSFDTTVKTIEAIKDECPDFVILGGDITDDYTEKEEMEELYRLFGDMDIPVYFIFGNHEVVQHAKYMKNGLNYTEEELVEAIESNGITILADEFVSLAPDLLLLGREDAALPEKRIDIKELYNPAPEKFLITADHQPTKAKDNLNAGTDLQLSGHTHAGQFFPNGFFMSFVSYCKGNYKLADGKNMLVSSGACGWRVPFRTESHCCFEVVTLKPAE